jgi:hypothetical protein
MNKPIPESNIQLRVQLHIIILTCGSCSNLCIQAFDFNISDQYADHMVNFYSDRMFETKSKEISFKLSYFTLWFLNFKYFLYLGFNIIITKSGWKISNFMFLKYIFKKYLCIYFKLIFYNNFISYWYHPTRGFQGQSRYFDTNKRVLPSWTLFKYYKK